ncbi:MAG: hypothetical protein GX050_03240 [Firmicutes bacterium]|nr:hypothetical protein [Bacillota bacterium]
MKPINFLLGLFLLLLGTVFFMNSIGYCSWALLRLSPLIGPFLLILLGIGLLWKERIPKGIAFGLVLLFVGVTVAFYLINPQFSPVQKAETHLLVNFDAYPELSAGKLKLKYGAGELTLGATSEHWVEGRFRGLPAVPNFTEKNRKLHLNIRPKIHIGRRSRAGQQRSVWKLNLSPQLPWEIELQTGAIKGNLNLTGIPLHQLNLKIGASAMEIRLGGNGQYSLVRIDTGASDLRIFVPVSVGLRVKLDGALTKTNLEASGLFFSNHRFVSENYESAAERIDLELNLAVSRLEIIRIPVPVHGATGPVI